MESKPPTLCHDPINHSKEEHATSSSTTNNERSQGGYQRKKVYQPKYPSLRAQQRRNRQVLVPKHKVQAQRLRDGDTHRWVERIATNTNKSSGWLSTQGSLEAQGYSYGNRELWLPKPEFISYKVPNKTAIPTGGHPRRRATTRNSKPKGKKPRQRYSKWSSSSNLSQPKANSVFVKTWIPKDKLAQMTTIGSKNFVKIVPTKNKEDQTCKEWLVPQNLIKTQGYYEGQT